ncbi:MAG: HNH endonuclease [Acutalibacteraceae bacterium]
MPKRPKSPCRWNGCSALTDERYCEEHKKLAEKHYNKYKRDPSTYKRYGNRWRRIRQLYIKEHPVCELCEKHGKITPVREIHHIIPLSQGGTHHEDNLMSLCKSCHSRITATEGGRWG